MGQFEQHVPLSDRFVETGVISPSGLYLSELSDRVGRRRRPRRPSMMSDVAGRELGTMMWREARAQTPHHDPAHEPLPDWVDRWHTAYDAGDDVTTYEGVRL